MNFRLTWLDFILIAIVSFSIYAILDNISAEEEKLKIEAENLGTSLSAELKLAIDDQFRIMDSVESFVKIDYDNEDFSDVFDQFVGPLYASNYAIKNISLAPEGVQTYVYPLEGNELVIGHDLINDKRDNVRADVARTIETRKTAVSGPYELRQGGLGLIARKAIYIDDQFWGLVAMVADFDEVLNQLSIYSINTNLSVELVGPRNEIIYTNRVLVGEVFTSKTIVLPEGEIVLRVGESKPSIQHLRNIYIQWSTLLLVMVLLSILVFMQNRKYLKSLQKELKDRTIQVNILSNELEKGKMMAIGSLVRGLCHEVNTPLGSSLTLMSFAQRELEASSISSPDLLELINESVNNINKSISIINRLRDITEIQSAHKVMDFNIKEYLEFAVSNSKLSVSNVAVDVRMECPNSFRVTNNPSAFYQVINLLIDNSLIHGFVHKSLGLIEIEVIEVDKGYKIYYKDDGVGIEEKAIRSIFEPYQTIDMAQFSGLGLYTAFTLVNNHIKGEILVDSVEGEYTRFEIFLPNISS